MEAKERQSVCTLTFILRKPCYELSSHLTKEDEAELAKPTTWSQAQSKPDSNSQIPPSDHMCKREICTYSCMQLRFRVLSHTAFMMHQLTEACGFSTKFSEFNLMNSEQWFSKCDHQHLLGAAPALSGNLVKTPGSQTRPT